MTKIHGVTIREDGRCLSTIGLAAHGQHELTVDAGDEDLLEGGKEFLETMILYTMERQHIAPGETVEYGYWLTKFVEINPTLLETWEYDAEGTRFEKGASLALRYWKEQHEMCQSAQSQFSPPRPDKLAAVAQGVFEGDSVDAVRYLPQGNMSGWCFFTDRYDGNIQSLKYEHLYHVTARRPDLAKYVALEPGFCFDLHDSQKVWFDRTASK